MMGNLQLTEDEVSTAREAGWTIVDVTATRRGTLTVLKLAFGNGETEVMSLGDAMIESVVAALTATAPKLDIVETLPIVVDYSEAGHMTASTVPNEAIAQTTSAAGAEVSFSGTT
jgi:hypothetical protein